MSAKAIPPRYVRVHSPQGSFVARLVHGREHGVNVLIFELLDHSLAVYSRRIVPCQTFAAGWWLEEAHEHDIRVAAPESKLLLEQILVAVCDFYRVPVEKVRGPSRVENVCWARHVYHFLARELTHHSMAAVARAGSSNPDKDHGIVLHSVRMLRARMDTDPQAVQDIETLKGLLRKGAPPVLRLLEVAA